MCKQCKAGDHSAHSAALGGICVGCPCPVDSRTITAADAGSTLTVAGGRITASTVTRTLAGPVVRYGVPGRTSRGKLKVRPGALRFPQNLSDVKLTREHDRDESRGHLRELDEGDTEIRASLKVSDGPDGDAALREAQDKTRDGFSFDIVDAVVVGDEIVSGRVIAIGQVGIPAYDDLRIDTIAASQSHEGITMLTAAQRARLAELRAMQNRSTEQEAELNGLIDLAAGPAEQPAEPAPVEQPAQPAAPAEPAAQPAAPAGGDDAGNVTASAARFGAVPGGVPGPSGAATTQPRGGQLEAFYGSVVDSIRGGGTITAALADVTSSDHDSIINPPAWSGELWSGVQYEPVFTDLFSSGDLTALKGEGWRWKTKMVIQDYAGDKVEIPTSTPETEASPWAAARMAVGVDVDRAFYDFPNTEFLRGLGEQVRESWAIKLDTKIRAYALANAVLVEGGVGVSTQPTLIKAAAVALRALKRRKVGTAGSWVVVNDDDLFTLLDVDQHSVPAFLELFGIDPKRFRSSQDVPAGTVLAGVKPAAKVRTLPGSPIRASAQNIANGGIDEGFFGYWAIEEHHTSGIAKSTFTPE